MSLSPSQKVRAAEIAKEHFSFGLSEAEAVYSVLRTINGSDEDYISPSDRPLSPESAGKIVAYLYAYLAKIEAQERDDVLVVERLLERLPAILSRLKQRSQA